jgi:hypothetical protein
MSAPIFNRKSAIRRSSIFSLQSKMVTLSAMVAAGVFLLVAAMPPQPAAIDASAWGELAARTVAGAYHVHTTRSDGHGDRTVVAAAAARAGLRFVILTDHGDATRPPDPPEYISGVLVIDAVEISTDQGHYIALDMPRAPYPLGGAAEAVVEDVHRLGGFGIAAHPDSPKPALRWTDDRAPIDGIEWLNMDSEWRDESPGRLARAGLAYVLRPGPALATLFDRPVTLNRWDYLTRFREVVALAGADAHGGVGRREEDTNRSLSGTVGIPSYEAAFRAFSNRVVLDRPLSGNAADDARAVYGAIRKGMVFTAIDALAGPALLDFHVDAGLDQIPMGGALPDDSDATIVARAPVPPGAELVLLRDGREVARGHDEIRRGLTEAHGAYRVEIRLPGAPGTRPVPWVVSNPIRFGAGLDGDQGARGAQGAEGPQAPAGAGGVRPFPWRIEKDASSSGILRSTDHDVALEYKLGDGPRSSQFVALATDLQRQAFSAIDLSLAGDRPARVSVQVRRADGARWGRSFYVDPAGTSLRIPLSTLRPIGGTVGISSIDVTSILLVIDLANARPGRSGVLRVSSSALLN